MKLYDTLAERLLTLDPDGDTVSIYVCGITPYDVTHLGHAFTYTTFDVLIRYLELRDLKVNYVQNVTDVDDDMLSRARQEGKDWTALGQTWTNYYIQDMKNLNVRPPDHFPRATKVIDDIIRQVEKLLAAGLAYQSNGNVYYDIDRFPEYGQLSHLPRSEMLPIANERGNHPDDPYKQDPLDFVLWQAQQPGEPAWDSPWGRGRPGWHIECSTMVRKYIGDTVDIHGGGIDLCFPHHESEIAQVKPLIKENKPFARIWMHIAMVRHDGEKMSKSLGNLVLIRDLLQDYNPDAVRLYLASKHYRKPWSYDEGDLKKYVELAEKLTRAATVTGGGGLRLNPAPVWAAFTRDLDNDLNSPGALKVMDGFADEILDAASVNRDIQDAQKALRDFCTVFGLRLDSVNAEDRVVKGWDQYMMPALET